MVRVLGFALLLILSLVQAASAKMSKEEEERCTLAAVMLGEIKGAKYKGEKPWPYKKSFEAIKAEECAAAKAIQGCYAVKDILCGYNPAASDSTALQPMADCGLNIGTVQTFEMDAYFGSAQAKLHMTKFCAKIRQLGGKCLRFIPKSCAGY